MKKRYSKAILKPFQTVSIQLILRVTRLKPGANEMNSKSSGTGDELIFEELPVNFPTIVFRQRVSKLDPARILVERDS